MTVLQKFPNNTTKHLINPNGRLSDCLCCCNGLPGLLFVHMCPTFLNAGGGTDVNCQQVDQSTNEALGQGTPLSLDTSNNCFDWKTNNATDFGVNVLQCDGGTPPGPDVLVWGFEAELHCNHPDIFTMDMCFRQTGHPANYPPDTTNCQPSQFVHRLNAQPGERTCNQSAGDFFIDFGIVQFFPCACSYHVYVTDVVTQACTGPNPVYLYPAESSQALKNSNLKGKLLHWEVLPGVGTPLHPKRPPKVTAPLPEFLKEWEDVGTRIEDGPDAED